jgi:hypothetical protein
MPTKKRATIKMVAMVKSFVFICSPLRTVSDFFKRDTPLYPFERGIPLHPVVDTGESRIHFLSHAILLFAFLELFVHGSKSD